MPNEKISDLTISPEAHLVNGDRRLVLAVWYAYTNSARKEIGIKERSPIESLPHGIGATEWNRLQSGSAVRLIRISDDNYYVTVKTTPGKISDPLKNFPESDGLTRIDLYDSISSLEEGQSLESVVLPRQRNQNVEPVITIPRDALETDPKILNQQNITLIMEDLWQRINNETWMQFGYGRFRM